MANSTGRAWMALVLGLAAAGARAGAAPPPTPGADGLARFVPKDAVVFIERRGHGAVREAMRASNFGAMAADETVAKFVGDSRVQIGRLIVKDLFDLKEPEDIEARRRQLHDVVEPFWQQPAAFCQAGPSESGTSMVLLCATGPYRAACRKALDELMKLDVPAEGVAGTKQAFTYHKGELVWKGLIKRREAFLLPKTPDERAAALANGSVFMVCWVDDLLIATTGAGGADAMSAMLSVTAPGASLAGEKAYQAVAARTGIKDWAFRWHVSVPGAIGASTPAEAEQRVQDMDPMLKTLGLGRVLAVGGSEGYADKLVTRRLLVYAPEADLTMRLIRPAGSYRRGVAMTPRGAMASLSGEIDVGVLTKLIAAGSAPRGNRGEEDSAPRPESAPATEPAGAAKNPVGEAIAKLVQAGDGNVAVFMLNLSIIGLGAGDGSLPGGMVMGLRDPLQARQAVEELARHLPGQEGGDKADKAAPATQGATRPGAAQPGAYRGAVIHRVGESQIVVLKDRAVIAFSRGALTAAVDAALDNTGGLPPNGKTAAMVDLEGEGALLGRVDVARLVGSFWPLLVTAASATDFPLASLPPTEKIVPLLGSEVVLLQATDSGILLKSRGYVPLLTKAPLAGAGLPYFLFRNLIGD